MEQTRTGQVATTSGNCIGAACSGAAVNNNTATSGEPITATVTQTGEGGGSGIDNRGDQAVDAGASGSTEDTAADNSSEAGSTTDGSPESDAGAAVSGGTEDTAADNSSEAGSTTDGSPESDAGAAVSGGTENTGGTGEDGSSGSVPVPIDTDNDGIMDGQDNCPASANPDQLDTDHDGQGNFCDTDDDNDGVSDEEEAALGTDPLLADSDGDGVSDAHEMSVIASGTDWNDKTAAWTATIEDFEFFFNGQAVSTDTWQAHWGNDFLHNDAVTFESWQASNQLFTASMPNPQVVVYGGGAGGDTTIQSTAGGGTYSGYDAIQANFTTPVAAAAIRIVSQSSDFQMKVYGSDGVLRNTYTLSAGSGPFFGVVATKANPIGAIRIIPGEVSPGHDLNTDYYEISELQFAR